MDVIMCVGQLFFVAGLDRLDLSTASQDRFYWFVMITMRLQKR